MPELAKCCCYGKTWTLRDDRTFPSQSPKLTWKIWPQGTYVVVQPKHQHEDSLCRRPRYRQWQRQLSFSFQGTQQSESAGEEHKIGTKLRLRIVSAAKIPKSGTKKKTAHIVSRREVDHWLYETNPFVRSGHTECPKTSKDFAVCHVVDGYARFRTCCDHKWKDMNTIVLNKARPLHWESSTQKKKEPPRPIEWL